MMDDKEAELEAALHENNAPLSQSEAKEALGGGVTADLVIDKRATIEDDQIVGLNGDVMEFDDVEDEPSEDDAEPEDDETAENDAEAESETDEADGSDEADEEPDVDVTVTDGDDETDDYHVINGIRIVSDPEEMLVGQRTDETYQHRTVLTNGSDAIPDPEVDYFPTKVKDSGRDSEEVVGRLMGVVDVPVLAEGPAGTGKNTLFDTLAQNANRRNYRMDFGDDTSVFDLIGEKDIVDGTSVYILGELSKTAIFGGDFVADEINMAEGDVTAHLHAITEADNRRLNLRGTGVTLRDLPDGVEWDPDQHLGKYIHPDFQFVATCNPLSYAGTSDMNAAFRSRFAVVELDYLEPKYEAKLLKQSTGIDEADAKELCQMAHTLREAHKNDELNCPITHRELKKTVDLAGADEEFMDFEDAAEIVFVGHASMKLDKQTIRDTLADEL